MRVIEASAPYFLSRAARSIAAAIGLALSIAVAALPKKTC